MKLWCVKVAYYYEEESPRDTLECDVKLFASKEEAVNELERAIRRDWTVELEVNENGEDVTKELADCRGKYEYASIKWSDWYYSEDGTLAWSYCGTHGYKGWVEEIEIPEIKKEATC